MNSIVFHPRPSHFLSPRRLVLRTTLSASAVILAVTLSGCDSRPPLEDLGELEFAVPNLPGMGEPFTLPNGDKVTPRTDEDEMRDAMMRQNPNLPFPDRAEPPTDGEPTPDSPPTEGDASAAPAAVPSQTGGSGNSNGRTDADPAG